MSNQGMVTILFAACAVLFASCGGATHSMPFTRTSGAQASVHGLNPMESVVATIDADYCIVRNDQTRRNPLTLRHRQSLQPVFDTHFEKYLDTFQLDGRSFLAVASWNPAFGYMWSAYVRTDQGWKQLLPPDYSNMQVVTPQGQPTQLQCTDRNGQSVSFTLQQLLSRQ